MHDLVGYWFDEAAYCEACMYAELLYRFGPGDFSELATWAGDHGYEVGDADANHLDDVESPPLNCRVCECRLWSPWRAPFVLPELPAALAWKAPGHAFECGRCERVDADPVRVMRCCEEGEAWPVVSHHDGWDRARTSMFETTNKE